MSQNPADEVTTGEALAILKLASPASITRAVKEGRLRASRKLPGKTGAYLFLRSDIEAFKAARDSAAEAVKVPS